ncbi:MAG: hypothetical protein Q9206_000012 [Seirophora lacunosa]
MDTSYVGYEPLPRKLPEGLVKLALPPRPPPPRELKPPLPPPRAPPLPPRSPPNPPRPRGAPRPPLPPPRPPRIRPPLDPPPARLGFADPYQAGDFTGIAAWVSVIALRTSGRTATSTSTKTTTAPSRRSSTRHIRN